MSPRSAIGRRDSDPPLETHWLAEDDECGIFAAGPRAYVVRMIASHFIAEHPDINPIVDGVDYRLYEAPWKCDTCGVPIEPPFWTHTAVSPIDLPLFVDTDGEWLLCQECHRLLTDRDSTKLAIRMIRMHEQNSPGLLVGEAGMNLRVTIVDQARQYVEHLDDGFLEHDASRH